ncbi:MAG: hypothetical protein KIH62_000085 [Candidatus Kerfeldbacteria bacterium]|nr:hypothetical protein [Candidatus Kerfeldbacteria bacterium]
MAFNLTEYLARHGAHVVPGNLLEEILEITGYKGLHVEPNRCKRGEHTTEMSKRLRRRFINREPEKAWHAVRATHQGTHLTLPTQLLIELGMISLPLDRFTPEITRKYKEILEVGVCGEEFVEFMYELDCYSPPAQMKPVVAEWLARLARGDESTVVITVCPDYSHENGSYNFRELWDGVGLVARRALQAAVLLHQMQQRTGTPLRIVVAIADFEGDSDTVCARLGISRDEFKARCQRSQQALRAEAEKLSPGIEEILETPLWSELVSRAEWESTLTRARESVAREELSGVFHLKPDELEGMARMRHPMYKRWHGEECDPVRIILSQAPEYGAVGALVARRFPNALILGADHVAMSPFLHMLLPALAPVVYMKKADY